MVLFLVPGHTSNAQAIIHDKLQEPLFTILLGGDNILVVIFNFICNHNLVFVGVVVESDLHRLISNLATSQSQKLGRDNNHAVFHCTAFLCQRYDANIH